MISFTWHVTTIEVYMNVCFPATNKWQREVQALADLATDRIKNVANAFFTKLWVYSGV